ncbi:MAG TPA: hypothetical protein VH165_37200 [Kofleriaceae bacterium]|nr:hypothetical protein [Kofleriaceae bacterium]
MTPVRLLAALGLLATGCLYIDPINQHPDIMSVTRQCPVDPGSFLPCDPEFQDLHRGDAVAVAATYHDPDGNDHQVSYHWQLFACSADGSCDSGAAVDSTDATPTLTIPKARALTGGPVQMVHLNLDLFDDRGARDSALRSVIINDGPSLGVHVEPTSQTMGGPIAVFATYGDPDGEAADVGLVWSATPPDGVATYMLADRMVIQNPDDPAHLTAGKTFVASIAGDWQVTVTATDASGKQTVKSVAIAVLPDRPPCIAQWQPIAAPDGTALPISAPTLFQVPLVDDDLDPYPAMPGQPLLGATAFAWSILRPGATVRQPLVGATGNSVALDPSAFTPGDIVELRVEIADRTHTPVTCDDGDAVCPVSPATCIQRQTWRVETR